MTEFGMMQRRGMGQALTSRILTADPRVSPDKPDIPQDAQD